ncbi:MAG: hypothetical protein ACK559_17375, partial [bacterium]
MRVADDGVFRIDAGGNLALVVAVEMIVVAMQAVVPERLHVTVLEEHVVDAVGVVVAPLVRVIGGIGHDRMMAAVLIEVR